MTEPKTQPSVDRHFARPGDGDSSSPIKVPLHKLTRRMTLEVTHMFSDMEAATARLAAIERGCSVNRVLRERLKSDVIRTLRSADYTVED